MPGKVNRSKPAQDEVAPGGNAADTVGVRPVGGRLGLSAGVQADQRRHQKGGAASGDRVHRHSSAAGEQCVGDLVSLRCADLDDGEVALA